MTCSFVSSPECLARAHQRSPQRLGSHPLESDNVLVAPPVDVLQDDKSLMARVQRLEGLLEQEAVLVCNDDVGEIPREGIAGARQVVVFWKGVTRWIAPSPLVDAKPPGDRREPRPFRTAGIQRVQRSVCPEKRFLDEILGRLRVYDESTYQPSNTRRAFDVKVMCVTR